MKRELGNLVYCIECWEGYNAEKKHKQREEEKKHGKVCRMCGIRKPLQNFYYRSETSTKKADKEKRHAYCIKCSKKRAKLNGKTRAAKLPYRYGISEEDFNILAEGGCQICGVSRHERMLVVDHEHDPEPGRPVFRGILCHLCNSGIGYFQDRPDLCHMAGVYLNEVKHVRRGGSQENA